MVLHLFITQMEHCRFMRKNNLSFLVSFADSIRKRCQNGSVESYINLRFSNTKPMIPKIVNGSSGIEKNSLKTGKNPLKNE